MDIKLKYEEALGIVAARNKAYAEDMDRLITLLVKRPLQGSIYDCRSQIKTKQVNTRETD